MRSSGYPCSFHLSQPSAGHKNPILAIYKPGVGHGEVSTLPGVPTLKTEAAAGARRGADHILQSELESQEKDSLTWTQLSVLICGECQ